VADQSRGRHPLTVILAPPSSSPLSALDPRRQRWLRARTTPRPGLRQALTLSSNGGDPQPSRSWTQNPRWTSPPPSPIPRTSSSSCPISSVSPSPRSPHAFPLMSVSFVHHAACPATFGLACLDAISVLGCQGYTRVLLAALAMHYMNHHPKYSTIAYCVSQLLDAVDGHAARYLGQASKFGAVLDMVTDRYVRTPSVPSFGHGH
jgi:hypothetical protein